MVAKDKNMLQVHINGSKSTNFLSNLTSFYSIDNEEIKNIVRS